MLLARGSAMRQADEIRTFVVERWIEPVRQRRERFVTIRADDVHKAMGLKNKMPAVCSALKARKFERFGNVKRIEATAPPQGSNLYLTFKLLQPGEAWYSGERAGVPGPWSGGRPETIRRIERRVSKLIVHFDCYVEEFDRAHLFTGRACISVSRR